MYFLLESGRYNLFDAFWNLQMSAEFTFLFTFLFTLEEGGKFELEIELVIGRGQETAPTCEADIILRVEASPLIQQDGK